MVVSDDAIGVMDSGVGGVSVLNALRLLLPYENYVYLSDSVNAPYGRRSSDEIKTIVLQNAERMVFMGCKALVIACNTATAVAISDLRKRFPAIPVVGLEPAVRPALVYAKEKGGDVLVLATDVTVREERFRRLCEKCCDELGFAFIGASENAFGLSNLRKSTVESPAVYALSIQNTVEYVEKLQGESISHTEYLRERFRLLPNRRFSAVVEGCTHFPFAEKSITQALGYCPAYFDGAYGAARRMAYLLERNEIARFSHEGGKGWVEWIDTGSKYASAESFRAFSRVRRNGPPK